MDSNCAETAGGGGALDLTWSTGWAALRAAKLISISWQRWRRDKFLTWDSSKPSVGSWPNPSAGGFYPSVVKFRPLCGLTCWRSTQLFYPIRDSEWFEAPTEREHWPLLNLIDGSEFETLDLIAEGSQQHQATPEYVNKPGCTHLELSLPTPWFFHQIPDHPFGFGDHVGKIHGINTNIHLLSAVIMILDRLWMMDPGIRLTTRLLGNESRRLGGRCGTMHKRNWRHGTLMIWWPWQALDNLRNFSRLLHGWNLFCSWGPSSWFWSPGWTSATRWMSCDCTSLNIHGLGWQAQGWGVWIWHDSCSSLLPTNIHMQSSCRPRSGQRHVCQV